MENEKRGREGRGDQDSVYLQKYPSLYRNYTCLKFRINQGCFRKNVIETWEMKFRINQGCIRKNVIETWEMTSKTLHCISLY